MLKKPVLKTTLLLSILSALAGCTSFEMRDRIDRLDVERTSHNQRYQNENKARLHDSNRQVGQEVNRPWIAGKAQPLARDAALPMVLQSKVNTTMLFSDGATDLVGLADRIQTATGVLVQVRPDALLPIDQFLPRLNIDTQARLIQRPDVADTLIPSISLLLTDGDRVSGPSMSGSSNRLKTVSLKEGQAPLSRVLDAISLRLGVYWKYDSNLAAIVFYRTETRSFVIKTQDLQFESDLDLGLAGSSGGSTNAGGGQFTSASKTAFKIDDKVNPGLEVVRKISQLMTKAGQIERAGGSNAIIVSDTKDSLDAIDAFLEKENKALTRRVRLLFEEVTIEHNDTAQSGIDWTAIYKSVGRMTVNNFSGVGSLIDGTNGAMDMTSGSGNGRWEGSSVSIKALSEVGKVLRRTSMPLLSLNRRPATYAVRDSFRFIDKMEQTQSTSDASEPTVTAEQVEETVGTFLTVIPDAQDDGQVLLTMNYNDSRLVSLTKENLGKNAFVQQPKISAQGMTQQVELRPGQTTLVAGFEQSNDNYTARRLDKDAPILLGGSNNTVEKSAVTLLFVTVIPEEGN